jgi:hypothetical protein
MFKKLAPSLFSFLIVSCGPAKHDGDAQVEQKIPSPIATLCEATPETQPGKPPPNSAEVLPEEWRQIEFVAAANRDYLTSKLTELEAFKKQHATKGGFSDVLARPEHPVTLRSLNLPAAKLPRLAEISLSFAEANIAGGFALGDNSDWFIYGQRSPDGKILELAVSPGYGTVPTEQFIRALTEIAGAQLLLVDWDAGIIVDTTSPDAVAAWTQRYKSVPSP